MTIKEIETRTGLPRASVRFYEREGFLSPSRGENKRSKSLLICMQETHRRSSQSASCAG